MTFFFIALSQPPTVQKLHLEKCKPSQLSIDSSVHIVKTQLSHSKAWEKFMQEF